MLFYREIAFPQFPTGQSFSLKPNLPIGRTPTFQESRQYQETITISQAAQAPVAPPERESPQPGPVDALQADSSTTDAAKASGSAKGVIPVADTTTASGATLPPDVEKHVGVLAGSTRQIDVSRTLKDPNGKIHYKENDVEYTLDQTKREGEIRTRLQDSLTQDGTGVDWEKYQELSVKANDRNGEVYAGLMQVTDDKGTFAASAENFATIGIRDQKVIDDILQGIGAKMGDRVSTTDIAKYMTKNPAKFESDPGLAQAFGTQALAKAGKWEAAQAVASYDFKGMNAAESKQKFLEMLQLIQKCLEAYQHLVNAYMNMRSVPGTGARGVVR